MKPRKRLGQHFLRDRSFLRQIFNAGEVGADDAVLEIGAGTGVLTRPLVERARQVLAVELDNSLYDLLRKQFADVPNLRLWHGNALDFDPCSQMPQPYKLIGNIPYYVTGRIVRHFLETECQPKLLVLMVQREVADRMVAPPGKLSLLGVSVQYYAQARTVARVPAGAFFPRPKVESSIVRLIPYRRGLPTVEQDRFFDVVRAGFSTRRKQLANALSNGLGISRAQAHHLLREAGIGERLRAESLSIDQWEALAKLWSGEDRAAVCQNQ